MYQQVCVLNRSLCASQWNQLRTVAQVNVKSIDDSHIEAAESLEWINAKPTSEIPGPTKFQFVRGFLPGGVFYKKSFTDFINEARKTYGDIYRTPGVFGKQSILFSFNPDDFKTAIRSEGVWPQRRIMDTIKYYRNVHKKEEFGGTGGLLVSNDETWSKLRSAVNPILMQPRNTRLYVNKMLEVNDEFLQRIREVRDPKTLEMPDNFEEDINRLTFESVAVVALNQQIGLIRKNRDSEEAKKLFKSLRSIINLTFDLEINPSIWKFIKTPKFYEMMENSDNMYNIIMKYINQAVERIESTNNTMDDSVLGKLLKIDKKVAMVMALDMLMAGVDTTSSTLVGILLCIAKNPDKQQKLRQEICSILPEKNSKLTIDNMNHLPYLRACIKEGIRIYPISPGILRKPSENIVLSGYQVPKNQDIILNSNLLLMDEQHYPNAKKFIPERWLRSEKDSQPEMNPFIYVPFGIGARSCVGKRLVQLELEITVARLVRNFNIEFNYPIENAFKSHLINMPAVPLKFKLSDIES